MRHVILVFLPLLVSLGCTDPLVCPGPTDAGSVGTDAGEGPTGYTVRGSWLLRGETPSAALCMADGIARVRLRVLQADATIVEEVTAPCGDGMLEGAMELPYSDRLYGEWAALAPDGAIRESIPVARRILANRPVETLALLPANFQPRPATWRDYRAGGRIYIADWTGPETCTLRNIQDFRLTMTPEGGGEPVVASVSCADATLEVPTQAIVDLRTAVALDWDRTYRVTWTAHASDGSTTMSLELAPVRLESPAIALMGLSILVLPTGLVAYF